MSTDRDTTVRPTEDGTEDVTAPRGRATDRGGLGVRAGLVLAAAVCGFLGAPSALSTALAVLATALVAERAARLRRRGLVDTTLVGVGGVLVVLALLGLVLNYLPTGLAARSWSVGAGLVALLVLAACAARPTPPSPARVLRQRPSLVTAVSVGAALVVLTSSLVLAVRSFESTEIPPLQLSATGPVVDGQLEVAVSTTGRVGPLSLVVVDDGQVTVVDPALVLEAGQSTTRTVEVPDGVRVSIELQYPGQGLPLRQIIVDGAGVAPEDFS